MKKTILSTVLLCICGSVQAADMSAWSDKTVCRLVEQQGKQEFIDEAVSRGLRCVQGENMQANTSKSASKQDAFSVPKREIPNTHFKPHQDIANLYKGYDRYLNKDFDFPSLRLSKNDFITGTFIGDNKTDAKGYYIKTMVQYADFGDLNGDNENDMVMGGWRANDKNSPARLHYLYFKYGIPNSTSHTEVEGTAAPWVRDFDADGKAEVLTVGFYDFPVRPAKSYYFPNGIDSKASIGPKIDSHESHVSDFDGDGDLDVLAITYGGVKNELSLYRNTGGKFNHEYLKIVGDPWMGGSSIVFDDFDGDGSVEILIGDAAYPKFDDEIWYYDLKFLDNHSIKLIPKQKLTGYFSDRKYRKLLTEFSSSKNPRDHDKKRSHDIFLGSSDVDNDGDKDIILGTVLWNNTSPFGALQIFINDGSGKFTDETNTRILNYRLSGDSAHSIFLEDVNGDGAVDIIMTDRNQWVSWVGVPLDSSLGYDLDKVTSGNRLLINDGTGHFVSTHENYFADFTVLRGWSNSWFPVVNADRTITFVSLFRTNDGQNDLWQYAKLKKPLSTGPKFKNPADRGVPEFNEFYVLRHNTEARSAVLSGDYDSALDWYLATKAEIKINAK